MSSNKGRRRKHLEFAIGRYLLLRGLDLLRCGSRGPAGGREVRRLRSVRRALIPRYSQTWQCLEDLGRPQALQQRDFKTQYIRLHLGSMNIGGQATCVAVSKVHLPM